MGNGIFSREPYALLNLGGTAALENELMDTGDNQLYLAHHPVFLFCHSRSAVAKASRVIHFCLHYPSISFDFLTSGSDQHHIPSGALRKIIFASFGGLVVEGNSDTNFYCCCSVVVLLCVALPRHKIFINAVSDHLDHFHNHIILLYC